VDSSATFPAAPAPARKQTAARIGAGVVGLVVLWGGLTVAGTGLELLFLGIVTVSVAPVLWQVGMTPQTYSVAGTTIHVHRRVLPDSTFTMRGSPEPLAAAMVAAAAHDRGEEGYGDGFARVSRRRTYTAVTDTRKSVRILVGQGALVISPEDPQRFIDATAGGRFP
jgi:hypothetical protein